MDCGMSLVKYVLFIFNLLCTLCGILLIAIGALIFANLHSLKSLEDASTYTNFSIGLIILGALIFVIAFFGCCGAIRESQCMSLTYASLLFILLVLDIALVAVVIINKQTLKEIPKKIVDQAWQSHGSEDSLIHVIELKNKCCGKMSYMDYGGLSLPNTCCGLEPSHERKCNANDAYKTGCDEAFTRFCEKYGEIVMYVCLGIIGVELIGMIFACCLANHIRNNNRRSTY